MPRHISQHKATIDERMSWFRMRWLFAFLTFLGLAGCDLGTRFDGDKVLGDYPDINSVPFGADAEKAFFPPLPKSFYTTDAQKLFEDGQTLHARGAALWEKTFGGPRPAEPSKEKPTSDFLAKEAS